MSGRARRTIINDYETSSAAADSEGSGWLVQ